MDQAAWVIATITFCIHKEAKYFWKLKLTMQCRFACRQAGIVLGRILFFGRLQICSKKPSRQFVHVVCNLRLTCFLPVVLCWGWQQQHPPKRWQKLQQTVARHHPCLYCYYCYCLEMILVTFYKTNFVTNDKKFKRLKNQW